MSLRIDFVPSANLGFSNAPTGPFIRIVLEDLITSANAFCDSGPASTPSKPSGMSLISTTLLVPLPEKSSVTRTSVAITSLTPLSAAFFSIAFATSNWSSSQIELPMLPPLAFTNV